MWRSFRHLPVSAIHIRRRLSRRVSVKCVHAIPLILFLCFFILWWFSRPVIVEMENGRILAVHRIKKVAAALNGTWVDFTILASAMPPTAEALPGNLTRYNENHTDETNWLPSQLVHID